MVNSDAVNMNGYHVMTLTDDYRDAAAAAFNVTTQTIVANLTSTSSQSDAFDANYRTCAIYDLAIEFVAMGILCCFGFVGNILSMICLWQDKSRTATPFLLVSLEIADTLFLLCVLQLRVLSTIFQFTGSTVFHTVTPYLAKYIYPFALVCETGTIYLTLLVTINRYISVCMPYQVSNFCSVRNSHRHVVLVWVFAWIYCIPRFFEYSIETTVDAATNDTIDISMATPLVSNRIYQVMYCNVMYFFVMFFVPLVTLCILNWRLVRALNKTQRKRKLMVSNREHTSRSEDDITLVLIVVVVVFIISQTPAMVTQLLIVFLPERLVSCAKPFFFYERISDLLVVFNSAINFLIYCFCSRRFRHILKTTLCKWYDGGAGSPETSTHNGNTRAQAPGNSTKYTTLAVRNGVNNDEPSHTQLSPVDIQL